MAHSSRGAAFAPGAPKGADVLGDDFGMLARVLQDIMPALARIQARAPQPMSHAGFAGRASSQMAPEAVAAVALVSEMGADCLRRLTAYLESYADSHDGLEACVPLVAAAAHALGGHDYAMAFTMIFDCYRTIAMLRTADPSLPWPGSLTAAAGEAQVRAGEAPHAESDAPPNQPN